MATRCLCSTRHVHTDAAPSYCASAVARLLQHWPLSAPVSWQNISRAWNEDSLPAANITADCCWTLQTQGHKDTSEGENKNSNLIIAWQRSSVCCAGVMRARVRPCLFIPSRLSPNIVVTQLNLQRRHKNKLLETLVYCHIRMNPDIKVHSVDNLVSIICSQQWARVTGNIFLCPKNICCVHRRRSRCTTLRATCGRRWRPRPASATTPCRCQGPCPSSGRYCRHVDK